MRQDRSFPALTAVRGIAALMVVTTHAAFNTGQILGAGPARCSPGWTSGSRSSSCSPGSCWPGRSSSRAGPRRTAAVGAALPVETGAADPAAVLGGGGGLRCYSTPRTAGPLRRLGANLTLTQLYTPDPAAESLTQMWSLCTEVAFYVLMPLLILLLRRAGGSRPRPRG